MCFLFCFFFFFFRSKWLKIRRQLGHETNDKAEGVSKKMKAVGVGSARILCQFVSRRRFYRDVHYSSVAVAQRAAGNDKDPMNFIKRTLRCRVQWHADAICQSLHRGLLYENYPAGTQPIKQPRKSFAAVKTNIKFTAAAACRNERDTLCSPLFSFRYVVPKNVQTIDYRKENSFVRFRRVPASDWFKN